MTYKAGSDAVSLAFRSVTLPPEDQRGSQTGSGVGESDKDGGELYFGRLRID